LQLALYFRRAENISRLHQRLDDSIASVVAARGVGRSWKYASDVVRIAKRNPDYVSDPYSMGVQPMRTVVYKIGDRLPEPFVSNLRSLIAPMLKMRAIPALSFQPDATLEYAMKIDALMHQPEVARDLEKPAE